MQSLPKGYRAIVFGASGGIGQAISAQLSADQRCREVLGLSRRSGPALDLTDEATICHAAEKAAAGGPVHLLFDATGVLHEGNILPEKSLSAVDPDHVARVIAVNATGPLLLLKHFSGLMPRDERSLFATISARVGSIGDNGLGGWYAYRASKAALNMMLRTASIEIARKRPKAVCLSLHPGTVNTSLSRPFSGTRTTLSPEESARAMLGVLDRTTPEQSGSFFAYDGTRIEW
ncbi:MAG: SDR family NAD(P)-dependent oxidoreductase [Pseudomonadota bacterium]